MADFNAGWTVNSTGAMCTDGIGEAWQSWIAFAHEDGRVVNIETDHTLYGEVTLYGERVGFEPFVTNVDDSYTAEVERLTEDGTFTVEEVERELGRAYWVASQCDRFDASVYGELIEDLPDPEENHYFAQDLDYTGSFEDMPSSVVEDVLRSYATHEARTHLQYTDLDELHANIIG